MHHLPPNRVFFEVFLRRMTTKDYYTYREKQEGGPRCRRLRFQYKKKSCDEAIRHVVEKCITEVTCEILGYEAPEGQASAGDAFLLSIDSSQRLMDDVLLLIFKIKVGVWKFLVRSLIWCVNVSLREKIKAEIPQARNIHVFLSAPLNRIL